jgi:transcription initiation factor TFIID TATA-box-binding protein
MRYRRIREACVAALVGALPLTALAYEGSETVCDDGLMMLAAGGGTAVLVAAQIVTRGSAAPRSAPALEVRNIVASVRVAGHLPLNELAMKIPGARLGRGRFKGMVIHLDPSGTACILFSSGNIVIMGLTDPDEIAPALAAVLEVLRTAGVEIDDAPPEARIVNLVMSGTFPDGVSLLQLARARDLERLEYEPEQFPGLVYRSETGPVVLIFNTGAIVVTGATATDEARAAAAEARGVIDAAGAWLPR